MGVRNYPVTAQTLGAPPALLGFYGGRGGTFMKEVHLFHQGLLCVFVFFVDGTNFRLPTVSFQVRRLTERKRLSNKLAQVYH